MGAWLGQHGKQKKGPLLETWYWKAFAWMQLLSSGQKWRTGKKHQYYSHALQRIHTTGGQRLIDVDCSSPPASSSLESSNQRLPVLHLVWNTILRVSSGYAEPSHQEPLVRPEEPPPNPLGGNISVRPGPVREEEALHIQMTPSGKHFNQDGGAEVSGCWIAFMRRQRKWRAILAKLWLPVTCILSTVEPCLMDTPQQQTPMI